MKQEINQSELKNRGTMKNLFFVGALIIGGVAYFVLSNSYSERSRLQTAINQDSVSKSTPLTKVKDDGRFVFYSGSITVSGEYQELDPETLLGGELCFYPNTETAYLIPRDQNLEGVGNRDTRLPWFCFKNKEKAKEMFGIDDNKIFSDKTIECIEGKATVKVSNYVVDKLPSSVFDTVNLDSIISKENYLTRCE